jgi:hypothetical protein
MLAEQGTEFIYYYEETGHPAGYSGEVKGYVEFKRNGTAIADINTIALNSSLTVTNNFDADTSYSMPVNKTINGTTVASTEVFSFLMKLKKIVVGGKEYTYDEDSTSDPADDVGENKVYTDAEYSKSLTSAGLTKTIKGSGTTIFAPVYFKAPGAYTFEISEKDLTDTQIANKFVKDSRIYQATITVNEDMSVSSNINLKVKNADGDFEACDSTVTVPTFDNTITIDKDSSASWTPTGKKILKGITAKEGQENPEYTFYFEILEGDTKVATGKADCNAENDYNADITFTVNSKSSYYSGTALNSLVFDGDDLGRHSFMIKEIVPKDADPDIDYVAEDVYTVVDVEAENGGLKATATYYTDLLEGDNKDKPQFVNNYHNRLTIPTTGINLDIMHYILVFILAGCAWTLYLFRRKKHRDKED